MFWLQLGLHQSLACSLFASTFLGGAPVDIDLIQIRPTEGHASPSFCLAGRHPIVALKRVNFDDPLQSPGEWIIWHVVDLVSGISLLRIGRGKHLALDLRCRITFAITFRVSFPSLVLSSLLTLSAYFS